MYRDVIWTLRYVTLKKKTEDYSKLVHEISDTMKKFIALIDCTKIVTKRPGEPE